MSCTAILHEPFEFQSTPDLINGENTKGEHVDSPLHWFQSTPDLINGENTKGEHVDSPLHWFQSTADLINRENLGMCMNITGV